MLLLSSPLASTTPSFSPVLLGSSSRAGRNIRGENGVRTNSAWTGTESYHAGFGLGAHDPTWHDKAGQHDLPPLPIMLDLTHLTCPSRRLSSIQKRFLVHCNGGIDFLDHREQSKVFSHYEENSRRRLVLIVVVTSGILTALPSFGKTKSKNPYDERRLLEQNKRIQRENSVPDEFPNFVREGFTVKVVTSDNYVRRDSGLILWDIAVGKGDSPKDGQQVTFHYVGYNESGRRIDSTYLQGTPAKIRMGTKGLVPGFEEGIRDMKPGGKRRIIIPPELGPPVGPSTFFSAKQFEVFDVELVDIQDCHRRTIGFYSDVVCN